MDRGIRKEVRIINMQIDHKEIVKNAVLYFLLLGCWLFLAHFLANAGDVSFPKRLALLNLLLVLGRYFFKSERCYWLITAILTSTLLSVLSIRVLVDTNSYWHTVVDSMIFAIALTEVVAIVPNLFRAKGLRAVVAALLWGSLFALAALFWAYYFAENTWLGYEAVLAIMQTNLSEAGSYVQGHNALLGGLVIAASIGILAAICRESYYYGGVAINGKKAGFLLSIFCILNLVMVNNMLSKNYFLEPFINAYKGLEEYNNFKAAREMRNVLIETSDISSDSRNGLYVLVIGESETREHMSAYGYSKLTTPWLADMSATSKALFFTQAYSCHTHTVQSLSYALTEKNQYNGIEAAKAVSLVETAKAAGYQVIWLSNQVHYGAWDTPISVIADAADKQIFINRNIGATTSTEDFDGALLNEVDKMELSDRILLIIHLMGCHGGYADRYPQEIGIFSGSDEVSHYDNAVYYNDMVMKSLYEKVSSVPVFQGMIYFSDHGEDVDDNLGHNSAKFQPVMAKIPLYMIFSDSYKQYHNDRYQVLSSARNKVFTNDLLYNTVLGVMGIHYAGHDEPQNDLSNSAYDDNIERFTTLYGKVKIKDIDK